MRLSPSVALGPRSSGTTAFTPLALTSLRGWYDPSDLATVWQDSAGTTPGAVGQPVGRLSDKSGLGNHLIQATTSFKPILRQSGALYYLEFDGIDDTIPPASNFLSAATTASAAWAAKRTGTLSGTNNGSILSDWGSGGGGSLEPWNGDNNFYQNFGSTTRPVFATNIATTVQSPYVLRLDRGAANLAAFINGSTSLGSNATTVGWGASPMVAFTYEGQLYGLILTAASLTASEITNVNAYLAAKNGAVIT